ncbi:MAG: SpoIIE family protein phosphatase [Bradymonadales bacterium]|jgi:sigma-B regulation protein RsbU (phosphoserine phosphatase)
MKLSIGLKWTATAVILVVLVVGVYAFMTIRDASSDVERQTERLTRVQEEALDEVGASTTRYLALPASSLMYNNDLSALTALLRPVVERGKEGSAAIYATIFAPQGRVWVVEASPDIERFKLGDATFFDKTRDERFLEQLAQGVLSDLVSISGHQDVEREITRGGEVRTVKVREYLAQIKGGEDLQGYILIAYSLEGLARELDSLRAEGEVKKASTLQRSIWLALLAIVLGILVAVIQSLAVSRNIKSLSRVASQIAQGDLSVRSNIRSRDEIGQLGTQFNIMADRVQALMAETEEKASLEKELDIARSIQSTLLPEQGLATCGRFSLNGYFQPASVCGGDFWSYKTLPDGSALLTMGDVTGHGVPSAMITASAKSGLDTLINMWDQSMSLALIMKELNKTICETARSNLFMTFIAMRLSADGRVLEVTNAGHNFPLMMRGGEVRAIVARGQRLGDDPASSYETTRVDVAPGDSFLLFTDGITEYVDASGQEYGERRLRKMFQEYATRDVSTAMAGIMADFQRFSASALPTDDITMMVAKIG